MPYCNDCGAQASDNASFCPECGSKLTAGPSVGREVNPKSSCPSCGSSDKVRWSVMNKSWRCDKCGHSFVISISASQPKESVKKATTLKKRGLASVSGEQGVGLERLHKWQAEEPIMGEISEAKLVGDETKPTKRIGLGILLVFVGRFLFVTGFFIEKVEFFVPVALLGTLLIIGGFIFYLQGCWSYAECKGYYGAWGLIGLLGLIGLIALVCFPNKHKRAQKKKML